MPKVIYVMGLPGAGKGTQAELLAKTIGYHRFSTGSAFRAVAQQDNELGRKVKSLIDNGILAPPELAAEIVISAIKDAVAHNKGLIFDGTPRTREEAAIVDNFFATRGYGKPLVVFLEVDKDEMIRRNSSRRFCLGLKSDFPVVNEQDAAKCEELGGQVGIRPDDAPDKFSKRWEEFHTHTMPVVDKYRAEGIVHEVDGLHPIDEVHRKVMKIVEAL